MFTPVTTSITRGKGIGFAAKNWSSAILSGLNARLPSPFHFFVLKLISFSLEERSAGTKVDGKTITFNIALASERCFVLIDTIIH